MNPQEPMFVGFQDKGDTLEFQYRSHSDPSKTWTTTVQNGIAVCNCTGYQAHGNCYMLADALGRAEMHRLASAPASVTVPVQVPAGRGGAVQRRDRAMLIPTAEEITSMIKLSNALALSAGFAIPDVFDSSPKVFSAVLYAWERDVPPMTVLNHCLIVNGRIEPDAQLMAGMIQRARPGARWKWIVEPSEAEGAEVELWINGMKRATGKWTPADALRSKQLEMPRRRVIAEWGERGANGKSRPIFAKDERGNILTEDQPGNWQLWPTRMYAWAVIKIAARLGASDLINGLDALTMGASTLMIEEEATAAPLMGGAGPTAREQFAEDPWALAPAENLARTAAETVIRDAHSAPQAAPEPAPAAAPAPEPSQATQTGYPWLPPLQALRARHFTAVDDRAIGAVVGAEGPDMLEAIDRWCFAGGPAADLSERMRELLKLATRWQLDQAEADALAGRQPAEPQAAMPLGARSMAEARKEWNDEDFDGR